MTRPANPSPDKAETAAAVSAKTGIPHQSYSYRFRSIVESPAALVSVPKIARRKR